jgi:hypothetical protein
MGEPAQAAVGPGAASQLDLGRGPNRWPVTLEKWYLDALLPGGVALLVYLGRLRLAGIELRRVSAELYRPGKAPQRGAAAAPRCTGGSGRLDFGLARIDGEWLAFETPGLSGELRYSPRYPPIEPRRPFLKSGHRRLLWSVEVPDADVAGRLTWPGGGLRIAGRGYRDRVWTDLLPWRFPIRRLVWGRAAAGRHAAFWVEADTAQGRVAARWLDGAALPADSPWPVRLGAPRVLVESAVADLEGLRLGAVRPLLRRLSGDPFEAKWSAPAVVLGDPGAAVHEVVVWR